MESKHTKGEWISQHFLHESSIYCPGEKKGIAKLKYCQFEYDDTEVEANADRIVKCVNAHEELVNCLQAFVYQIETYNLKHEFPGAYMGAKNVLTKLKNTEVTNEK